jgi:glutamate-1-semialdehyde 2,1-aminomutase
VDGNSYIDYHAAWGPVVLGHSHPRVVGAVKKAIDETVLFGLGVTEAEAGLARKIVGHVPSAEQILFCSSGSEATLHSIRVSRAVTGREKIIKFQGVYHGFHDYVMRNLYGSWDTLGKRDPSSAGMLDAAVDATLVCRYNDLEDVERVLRENEGQVAAVIVEPIAHNAPSMLPKPGFLEGLRKLCDREGSLLIFDEIITGFRHHLGGYQAICGVYPDLTTMGKAMANGFTVAAVGGRRQYMQRYDTDPGGDVFFGGTYNGGSSGVAAALATIELMEKEDVLGHIFRLGDRLRDGLRRVSETVGVAATVTGYGSLFTLLFLDGPVHSWEDVLRNDADLDVRYRQELIARGVFVMPTKFARGHISYSHTDEDIDRTLEVAEAALRAALDQSAARH